jgi:uncharacterized small protein (DUF1192 family)
MDEDEVRPKQELGFPRPLAGFSIEDLRAYIVAMRAEIERVEAEIAKRQDVRGAAEALFRPPAADR